MESVDKAMAEDPKSYLVTINGGSYMLPDGAVSYDPATRRITLCGIPFRQRDRIGVTALGLWDRMKNIPGPSVSCIVEVPVWPHLRSAVLIFVAIVALGMAIVVTALL
jgi:hypothetical protein